MLSVWDIVFENKTIGYVVIDHTKIVENRTVHVVVENKMYPVLRQDSFKKQLIVGSETINVFVGKPTAKGEEC